MRTTSTARFLIVVLTALAACFGAVLAAPEEPPRPTEDEIAVLRAAVVRSPDDPGAHRLLGMALLVAGRGAEAIAELERQVALREDARSLLDLALAQGSLSQVERAEATYRRILALEPGHVVALHNLGNLAAKRGDVESSISLYRRALELRPDYLMAQVHLGDALRQAERWEEAYRAYERALELEPRDADELALLDEALYRLAALDLQMGAYERAGALLVELLRENPEHPKANYALGQVLMHLGRVDEAQRAFAAHERVLAKQPQGGTMAHEE